MKLRHDSGSMLALNLLLVVLHTAVATLPPPERPYNILMMTPVSTKSHKNIFLALATELSKRGHQITLLSNHPADEEIHNIRQIEHGLPYFREENINTFEMRNNIEKSREIYRKNIQLMAKHFYSVPAMKQLYEQRDEFDLVIIDNLCNEVVFPFTHQKIFITIAVLGLEPVHSGVMGNFLKPAYANTAMFFFKSPLTFLSRLTNIFLTVAIAYIWRHEDNLPITQAQIKEQFPDLPPLMELEKNQSLVLLNSHFSMAGSLPTVPAQIQVGGMHCRPGKPLPEDINKFVSGNETVIYFSLGSFVRGPNLPEHYYHLLKSVLSELPYKIIWKIEDQDQEYPKNIMTKNWMPQQDILGHPNVKLFISHCGLMSVLETKYHAVPILCLPLFADQHKNAHHVQDRGIGIFLPWESLDEKTLITTVQELINNKRYKEEVSQISTIFKDQPQPPVERAVYWTEYVIRHSGAVHLRSPERDLSWVQLLHLDILLLLHIIVFLTVWIVKKIFRLCFGFKDAKKINKKKRL